MPHWPSMRSHLISESVHAQLQVSVCSGYDLFLVNIQTHRQTAFDQLIWKAQSAKSETLSVISNLLMNVIRCTCTKYSYPLARLWTSEKTVNLRRRTWQNASFDDVMHNMSWRNTLSSHSSSDVGPPEGFTIHQAKRGIVCVWGAWQAQNFARDQKQNRWPVTITVSVNTKKDYWSSCIRLMINAGISGISECGSV